jgi:6-phosphofructokinase
MPSSSTNSRPQTHAVNIRRVAILFSGGPAPAANAVISTAAASFVRSGISVVGILDGYSHLMQYSAEHPLLPDRHFRFMSESTLRRTRNTQGVLVRTARANPGELVSHPDHLKDPERVAPLRRVYEGLCSLEVDALVSIGGDDTLKTANKFKLFQQHWPLGKLIPVVHLPKTIDNDYHGIDFTFGFFTAVHTLAEEIRNLLADAEANSNYFLAETMGRSAGWLAYGAAIAGEASLVFSLEDIRGRYRTSEEYRDEQGELKTREVMRVEEVVRRIVATIRRREDDGKDFGVIVMAEGMAELLPMKYIQGVGRDAHGHLAISGIGMHEIFAGLIEKEYKAQTGRQRKVKALQLGYESRCARPHAFDVLLGSQLGVGAFRALVQRRYNGVMVSVARQLDLTYVPFEDLVDPQTLVTVVRYVEPTSDFYYLARFLETQIDDPDLATALPEPMVLASA